MLNEPSVVAINTKNNAIPLRHCRRGQGDDRPHPGHIVAIRPLKDGVIADFDTTEKMLRYFVHKVHRRQPGQALVVCASPASPGRAAGRGRVDLPGWARSAFIIEEPMAAAIGVGLPVHEPAGNMVVDIGGGTTEVAVVALGGIVTSQSIRIGGDELDESIISYIKKEYC